MCGSDSEKRRYVRSLRSTESSAVGELRTWKRRSVPHSPSQHQSQVAVSLDRLETVVHVAASTLSPIQSVFTVHFVFPMMVLISTHLATSNDTRSKSGHFGTGLGSERGMERR